MKYSTIFFLCIILFSFNFKDEVIYGENTISFEFSNIKSDEGEIVIAVYNKVDQYTDNPFKTYRIDKSTQKNSLIFIKYQIYHLENMFLLC